MKYKTLLSVMLISFYSSLISAQAINSKWQPFLLKLDSDNIDWGDRPGFFNGETGILYEIRNNDEYLYLLIEIPDERTQMKIMRSGILAGFKVKAKPKITGEIVFNKIERDIMPPIEGLIPDFENMQQSYLIANNYAETNGFLITQGLVKIGNSADKALSYAIQWDERNSLKYLIKIPMSELFSKSDALENIGKIPITIDLKIQATNKPNHFQGNDDFSMQGGGGRGRQMGQPGGELQHGGNPGEMGASSREQGFRFTVKLASK